VLGIMRWVRLHPYNISQKVQIVVEHFLENVTPHLDGKAKAMVVLSSRLEAVRWKIAIEKYIRDRGYKVVSVNLRLHRFPLDCARLRRRRFASPVAASSRAATRPVG
jgi:hypothetical protein